MFVDSISWQEHHHGRIIEIEAEMETFVHRTDRLRNYLHPKPHPNSLIAYKYARFIDLDADDDLGRLDLCDQLLDHFNCQPASQPECYDSPKSTERHEKARRVAEKYFANALMGRSALEMLNKSLAHANNTEQTSMSMVLRSTLCYMLKAFAPCMENINMMRQMDCVHYVSRDIRLRCHRKLQEERRRGPRMIWGTQQRYPYELYHPRLRDGPFAGSTVDWAVQLRQGSDGRCQRVICTEALLPGHIIAIDRGLFPTLAVTATWRRCGQCFAEPPMGLLRPCPGCSATLFCGNRCVQLALAGFHRYECRLAGMLQRRPALRPIVRLLLDTFGDAAAVADMMALCESRKGFGVWLKHNYFALGRQQQNDGRLPANAAAKLVYALSERDEYTAADGANAFHIARQAAYLYRVLEHKTEFVRELFDTAAKQLFLRRYIYTHMQILAVHAVRPHRMSSCVRFTEDRQSAADATRAVWPLWSTLRHSCQPNVVAVALTATKLALCAVRPIAANQTLTVDRTHGLHALGDAVAKHRLLGSVFRMRCRCRRTRKHDAQSIANKPDLASGVEMKKMWQAADWLGKRDAPPIVMNDRDAAAAAAAAAAANSNRNAATFVCRRHDAPVMPYSNPMSPSLFHGREMLAKLGSLAKYGQLHEEDSMPTVAERMTKLSLILAAEDALHPCRELWMVGQLFELCLERLLWPSFALDVGVDDFALTTRAWEVELRKRHQLLHESKMPMMGASAMVTAAMIGGRPKPIDQLQSESTSTRTFTDSDSSDVETVVEKIERTVATWRRPDKVAAAAEVVVEQQGTVDEPSGSSSMASASTVSTTLTSGRHECEGGTGIKETQPPRVRRSSSLIHVQQPSLAMRPASVGGTPVSCCLEGALRDTSAAD